MRIRSLLIALILSTQPVVAQAQTNDQCAEDFVASLLQKPTTEVAELVFEKYMAREIFAQKVYPTTWNTLSQTQKKNKYSQAHDGLAKFFSKYNTHLKRARKQVFRKQQNPRIRFSNLFATLDMTFVSSTRTCLFTDIYVHLQAKPFLNDKGFVSQKLRESLASK